MKTILQVVVSSRRAIRGASVGWMHGSELRAHIRHAGGLGSVWRNSITSSQIYEPFLMLRMSAAMRDSTQGDDSQPSCSAAKGTFENLQSVKPSITFSTLTWHAWPARPSLAAWPARWWLKALGPSAAQPVQRMLCRLERACLPAIPDRDGPTILRLSQQRAVRINWRHGPSRRIHQWL